MNAMVKMCVHVKLLRSKLVPSRCHGTNFFESESWRVATCVFRSETWKCERFCGCLLASCKGKNVVVFFFFFLVLLGFFKRKFFEGPSFCGAIDASSVHVAKARG